MNNRNTKNGFCLSQISFALLITVIFTFSSCATSGFLGFGDPLATSSYVDSATLESTERITKTEAEMSRIEDEIEDMKIDLKAVSNIKADLDEMPIEMLRQLVQALQSYLEMLEKE